MRMSLPRWMRVFVCVMAVLIVDRSVFAQSAQQPNIVLIISDDQAWTDYGFMGHDVIQTPCLDRLASQSATFERGYVPTSLCRPSLMTLATGLYSHQNRTTGNDPAETAANAGHAEKSGVANREMLISHVDQVPTAARLLGPLGYLSHQSGKWWEGSYQRGGFTHGMTRGYPERGGRHGDDGLKIGREGMTPVFDFIDMAVEQQKPFFVWYAPFLPHTPHNPPERLLTKYQAEGRPEPVAKYYAMCEWFDETCGQLLDRLDEKGVADNTLVVYVTDNGWVQKPSGGYAERSKRSPYECGIRTPIMFRWPGVIDAASRPELCSSIDIVPTILAAAGADTPENLPGLNLIPALRDGERIERKAIFGEAFAHDIADIERPDASLLYRWVIDGNWKLLLTYDGRQGKMKYPPTDAAPQLFDLKADPHETTNLAAEKEALVTRLTRRIDQWWWSGPRQQGVAAPTPTVKKAARKAPRRQTRSADSGASKSAPNILFFFADDQRFDTLGCAGHPIVQTPAIDRLADEGVRFDQMFVSHSICWVSRTTILTGLTARSFGERDKPDQAKPEALAALYPDILRDGGYRTGFYGKWHAKMPAGFKPEDHYDQFQKISRNPFFKQMPDGTERHETEMIGDCGVEFLRSQPKDQPFCLNLWFNASHAEDRDKRPGIGHFPWPKATDGMYEDIVVPPPRLNDPAIFASQPEFLQQSINRERYFWRWDTPEKYQTNIRAYFRMATGIDNVVARVMEELERQGLADNTIVVYSADNGYYMGDRGFAGKWSHYEQSLHVPLIVYDPRLPKEQRGRVVDPMVMNLDLPATFVDWAGLEVPEMYQGRSLKPIVEGRSPKSWREDMFVEHVTLRPLISWEGVRNSRYKYARYFDQEADNEFLHDLEQDPDELENKVADPEYAKILEELRARTDALVEKYGGPLKPL